MANQFHNRYGELHDFRKKLIAKTHFMDSGGPIFDSYPTKVEAFVFWDDVQLGKIASLSGTVEVLQMVGVSREALNWGKRNTMSKLVQKIANKQNPYMLTDIG